MIELPEALTLARELNAAVSGKTVAGVKPPTKAHRFCWFNGEPASYDERLKGCTAESAEGFGIYVELCFSRGMKLCFNDGVNVRLINEADAPKDHQLLIVFDDGMALSFTVAMYGGIILHGGEYDNEYYIKSREALSPFTEEFKAYYRKLYLQSSPKLSAKAFLATEQRFPGIGNGVAQDILFSAGIHPKRKIGTMTEAEHERLLSCIVSVLRSMCALGGRDTEKDLHGCNGGYKTLMSKNTLTTGCPVCGGEITKEAYLGGSVYYCPGCQPLN